MTKLSNSGSVQRGYCFLPEIEHGLHEFQIEAKKLLDNSQKKLNM